MIASFPLIGMATISSPGIGSGLDINSIVSQLVAIERQPLVALQAQATNLQTRLSTYGKVQASLAALRDAASVLTKSDTWGQTIGTSSDPVAVSVAEGSTTKPGSYAIEVQRLAAAQSNATAVFPSADALIGVGTLHIELGTWGAGQTTFVPKAGAVDITVGPPAQSLAQLRDTINAANAGVTASILVDASGARLVLRSSASGAANAFRAIVDDADGNHVDASGLSALAFDPSAGIVTMAQALAAANAAASLNGLAIDAAGNTLSDVLDGMTLTLGKVTTVPVNVTASPDKSALKKAIDAFVTAYNEVNKLLAEQTRYDPSTKTAGALQGDSAAVSMRAQLRNLLGETSGASTTFTRVADIGFNVQRDGSIQLNATKLDNGLANLDETRKLFSNVDLLAPANDGIATRLRRLADQMLGIDGTISTRSDGLRKRIDLNQDRQAELTDPIAAIEKRLRAQYAALDRQMGQLAGLSGYVTQQIAQFNRNRDR